MTMQDTTPRVKPTYGYYRQPDGFVTLSPATDLDELKYIRMGWTALRQYGKFEVTSPYVASHPLEGLFMAGGAHELSVEQIQKQGLYQEPIKVPGCGKALNQFHPHHFPECHTQSRVVVFPQIEGMDLQPFPCSFGCGRDLPTEHARQQHESVAHAPEKGDERTGKSLAEALILGLGGNSPVPAGADNSMLNDALSRARDREIALTQELNDLKGTVVPDLSGIQQEMARMAGEIATLRSAAKARPAVAKRKRSPNRPKVAVPA